MTVTRDARPPAGSWQQIPTVVVAGLGAIVMLLVGQGAAEREVVTAPPAVAHEARALASAFSARAVAASAVVIGGAVTPLTDATASSVPVGVASPLPASGGETPRASVEAVPALAVAVSPLRATELSAAASTPEPASGSLSVSLAAAPAVPPAPPAPIAASAVATAAASPPTGSTAAASARAVEPPSPTLSGREQRLLDAMNAQRAAAGLPPLLTNGTLTQAARSRSQDMASSGYFAHISPQGQSWYTALAAVGWTMSSGGENLAKVSGDESTSAAVAIDRLMASPTHRANIVSRAFRLVGVGASIDPSGATIFTTIFTDR